MHTVEKIILDNRYKRESRYAKSDRPKRRRIGEIMWITCLLDMSYLFMFKLS